MRSLIYRWTTVLLLAALPMLPLSTAAAAAPEQKPEPGVIRLHLTAEALPPAVPTDGAPAAPTPVVESVRSPELNAATLRDAIDREAQTQAERSAQEKTATKPMRLGKTRRWLKRNWWVPVVAGVALGVALADDDSDAPAPPPSG